MMFYGNKFRTLSGVIREVQKNMVKIEFTDPNSAHKIVPVPKNIINSEFRYETNIEQNFSIPTSYLRRNRIISLNYLFSCPHS